MASRPPRYRRRSVVDYSDAQTGDVSSRDSAGGDIHHHGADANAFIRDYLWHEDQRYEIEAEERRQRQAQFDAWREQIDARLRRVEQMQVAVVVAFGMTLLAYVIRTFELGRAVIAWIGL